MTIDWMKPSEDVVEAKGVGYDEGHLEGYATGSADNHEIWDHEVRELYKLVAGEDMDAESESVESLKVAIGKLKADLEKAKFAECDHMEACNFLKSIGYRRCDVPACNCGSWHKQ